MRECVPEAGLEPPYPTELASPSPSSGASALSSITERRRVSREGCFKMTDELSQSLVSD